MTDINEPPEQELAVQDVHFVTRHRDVDDPPEVMMVVDVQHEDAGLSWRQQLRMSRRMFLDLGALINTVIKNEKL